MKLFKKYENKNIYNVVNNKYNFINIIHNKQN